MCESVRFDAPLVPSIAKLEMWAPILIALVRRVSMGLQSHTTFVAGSTQLMSEGNWFLILQFMK